MLQVAKRWDERSEESRRYLSQRLCDFLHELIVLSASTSGSAPFWSEESRPRRHLHQQDLSYSTVLLSDADIERSSCWAIEVRLATECI